jgi:hypothetical protein
LGLGVTIDFKGVIRSGKRKFLIYYYEFVNPESGHGYSRVFVLGPGCKYHGSYFVEDPPTRVVGEDVYFDHAKDADRAIHFSHGRMPRRVSIDGFYAELEK